MFLKMLFFFFLSFVPFGRYTFPQSQRDAIDLDQGESLGSLVSACEAQCRLSVGSVQAH